MEMISVLAGTEEQTLFSVVLREAREADIPDIMKIEHDCFSDPWTERMMAEYLNPGLHSLYVAEKQATPMRDFFPEEYSTEVIGFLASTTALDEWNLDDVAVKTEFRGNGIAAHLVRMALKDAEARGATTAFLEVREGNKAARALYEKLGFTPYGKRPDYYLEPKENAILYKTEKLC